MTRRVVLDASALVIFFTNAAGAAKVESLLTDALEGKSRVSMSAVNWGEVYYATWRNQGKAAADRVISEIARLPIEIEAATLEATKMSAEIKATYRLPYADAFAASLAKRENAQLLTADSDFSVLKGVIAIQFI
ncbi:MAG: type II toxin-antitoxin system VapC family toxin [Candidatus Acidiferrales bacterium]